MHGPALARLQLGWFGWYRGTRLIAIGRPPAAFPLAPAVAARSLTVAAFSLCLAALQFDPSEIIEVGDTCVFHRRSRQRWQWGSSSAESARSSRLEPPCSGRTAEVCALSGCRRVSASAQVYVRATGGEVGAASSLAPKIGPLGLSPKKVRCSLVLPGCLPRQQALVHATAGAQRGHGFGVILTS